MSRFLWNFCLFSFPWEGTVGKKPSENWGIGLESAPEHYQLSPKGEDHPEAKKQLKKKTFFLFGRWPLSGDSL